jgi:RecG-like helicase
VILEIDSKKWKESRGIAANAREASGDIYTLRDKIMFEVVHTQVTQQWILVIRVHQESRKQVQIYNVYALVQYKEKSDCWKYLSEILDFRYVKKNIVACDFNMVVSNKDKGEGSVVWDHFRERRDDIKDLVNVAPKRVKYTWSN